MSITLTNEDYDVWDEEQGVWHLSRRLRQSIERLSGQPMNPIFRPFPEYRPPITVHPLVIKNYLTHGLLRNLRGEHDGLWPVDSVEEDLPEPVDDEVPNSFSELFEDGHAGSGAVTEPTASMEALALGRVGWFISDPRSEVPMIQPVSSSTRRLIVRLPLLMRKREAAGKKRAAVALQRRETVENAISPTPPLPKRKRRDSGEEWQPLPPLSKGEEVERKLLLASFQKNVPGKKRDSATTVRVRQLAEGKTGPLADRKEETVKRNLTPASLSTQKPLQQPLASSRVKTLKPEANKAPPSLPKQRAVQEKQFLTSPKMPEPKKVKAASAPVQKQEPSKKTLPVGPSLIVAGPASTPVLKTREPKEKQSVPLPSQNQEQSKALLSFKSSSTTIGPALKPPATQKQEPSNKKLPSNPPPTSAATTTQPYTLVPVWSYSDGPKTALTTRPTFQRNDLYFQERLALAYMSLQSIPTQRGVKYRLDRLPRGYSGWVKVRENGHRDWTTLGHPNGRAFKSFTDLWTHCLGLIEGGRDGCGCTLCGGGG
ncbi:hypothetical protein TI39_contig742g00016 [Zymoseptoria brevis]|uniref:Cryptic loci regulator 2 N-terminal domain-containing protein n=1 Tax=Zymoseptoria brevis TaxID=1047168 RepID=A0A0F4GFI7_9PEZI|nr:hypothetical protein TI39_contig742g00016 [Zymoseptoria brevis]